LVARYHVCILGIWWLYHICITFRTVELPLCIAIQDVSSFIKLCMFPPRWLFSSLC
jgi:hypothetical protein